MRGLLLQREVGDGAEGAGRIVVEGEPVHTLGLVVGPLAAEDDDGAALPAQHLSRALLLGVGFAQHDLAQRGPGCGERTLRDRVEEQQQRGAVGGGQRG